MTRPETPPSIGRDFEIRTCPACHHEHGIGTTCRACETCRTQDLVAIAQEVFAVLLPGGTDAIAAQGRHRRQTSGCEVDVKALATCPAVGTTIPMGLA